MMGPGPLPSWSHWCAFQHMDYSGGFSLTNLAVTCWWSAQWTNSKNTVCKAYEVNSVTTALIMTTVAGLLVEGHEMTPHYFCLNTDFLMHLRQTYVAICIYCLSACILCVVLCTLNFFYLNSLSPKDAELYLTPRGGGLQGVGETMIFLVEAYILFTMAIGVWVGTQYGAMFLLIAVTLLCSNGYVVTRRWRNLSKFNPEKVEKMWKEKMIIEMKKHEGRDSFESVDENYYKRKTVLWLKDASKRKLRECHPDGHWKKKQKDSQTSQDKGNNSSLPGFAFFGWFSKSTSSSLDEQHDKTGKKVPLSQEKSVQWAGVQVQTPEVEEPQKTLLSQSSLQSEWWDPHSEQLEKRRGGFGAGEMPGPMPVEDRAKTKSKQKGFKKKDKKATPGPHGHASSSPTGAGLPVTELPALDILWPA